MNLSFALPLLLVPHATRLIMRLRNALVSSWELLPFVNLGPGDITTLYIDDVPQEIAQKVVNCVWDVVRDLSDDIDDGEISISRSLVE